MSTSRACLMLLGMNFTFGTEYLVGSEKGTLRYGLRQSRAAGSDGSSSWRRGRRPALATQKEIPVSLHKR